MICVTLKPLSINEAWVGKLRKTPKHHKYRADLLYLLPVNFTMPPPPYLLHLEWGFSSKASDFDNPVKIFVDALAERYKFNDKLIKRCIIDVNHVATGKEYCAFAIETFKQF